ncbi:RAMP superfamily CRISPR-associated protein [Helicobacter sp. T3_23-1056]
MSKNSEVIHYKITFLDFWHLSSGLSGGVRFDNSAIKDSDGFPFVPAKSLKGVLREVAVANKEHFLSDFVESCFGEEVQKNRAPNAGACHFSNAILSQSTKKELKAQNLTHFLYAKIASTAIDERYGSAKEGSLREIEVVKPISLYGTIHNVPSNYVESMQNLLKSLKSMGLNRNRGLGRLEIVSANPSADSTH